MTEPVRDIANAVLYEGYILWPYRRSALKNTQRWTFGGVYPLAWSRAHPDDRASVQAQVLVEGDDPAGGPGGGAVGGRRPGGGGIGAFPAGGGAAAVRRRRARRRAGGRRRAAR